MPLAAVVLLVGALCAAAAVAPPGPLLADVLSAIGAATNATLAVTAFDSYPGLGHPGGAPGWRLTDYHAWTCGFFPATLWLLAAADAPAAPYWRRHAEARTAPLAPAADINSTHDLGFMVYLPFGAQWALTGNDTARAVASRAAHTLARRFVPAVGAFRSWGQPNAAHSMQVIVDNMMYLELIWWAAAEERNTTLLGMARSHASVTARDFFQPFARGCVWHLCVYNDSTGALLARTSTSGGLGEDTVWSQGQAWALAGYTIAFRFTRDPVDLAQALLAADCFLACTASGPFASTNQPLWDFNATQQSVPGLVVDVSAGAIAAAGLVELASFAPPEQRTRYLAAASNIITGVLAHWRFAPGTNDAVVANGTLLPDVGIATAWAEYYVLQAAIRWNAMPQQWCDEAERLLAAVPLVD